MTERERLIELIPTFCKKENVLQFNKEILNKFADYLLENGVIVPPCKVFSDVYLIVNGIIERCAVEGIYYTRRKNYVRLRPYHQEYLGNWSKYYTPSLRSFGKTVFLTREEAEQALKGGA